MSASASTTRRVTVREFMGSFYLIGPWEKRGGGERARSREQGEALPQG